MSLGKLNSIQTLRAVAVLAVAFFHATYDSGGRVGAAGVDLFFVISGYIIARISEGRDRQSFVFDRVWRIFPLYLLCTAAALLTLKGQGSSCRDIATATLLPLPCEPYLGIAWTLQYELFFYILATLCIGRPKALIASIATLAVLGVFLPLGKVGSPLLLEFLAGVLIARLPLNRVVGIGAVGASIAIFYVTAPWEVGLGTFTRVLAWGGPSVLLVYGALSLERHFKPGLVVEIGNASYAIYLVHLLVLAQLPTVIWPLALWIMVCVGIALHWLVEKPLLRLKPALRHIGFTRRAEPIGTISTL